ncbi:MAG TPA: hypothetical protein VGS07_24950 [Thermoanaerobaculia bacterium]|jgi:hypothetical protein|nr:hypothetical protein [Thermoanaerobaculia bacterium]
MRFHRTTTLMLVLLVGCIALFGCKKKEEAPPPEVTPAAVETPAPVVTPAVVAFKVTSIDLGKAIDASKKVTDPATTFAPKDTIYAVANSEGSAASVKLTAKWTYGEKAKSVKDDDVTITPTGPAATDFHISQAKGLPVGHYKVEILADGTSAGTKEFDVKK